MPSVSILIQSRISFSFFASFIYSHHRSQVAPVSVLEIVALAHAPSGDPSTKITQSFTSNPSLAKQYVWALNLSPLIIKKESSWATCILYSVIANEGVEHSNTKAKNIFFIFPLFC